MNTLTNDSCTSASHIFRFLSEANPGTLSVLAKVRDLVGEQQMIDLCINMNARNWTGPHIWILFSDVCGYDLSKFVALYANPGSLAHDAEQQAVTAFMREGLGV